FIWPLGDTHIVGHGGSFPGFTTAMGMDMGRRLGVVVLTNVIGGPAKSLMVGAFQTMYDCLQRADKHRGSVREAAIRRYEGRYAGRWSYLDVQVGGGRLVAYDPESDRPLQDANELEARGPGRFRIVAGPGSGPIGELAVFDTDGAGAVRGLRWGPN